MANGFDGLCVAIFEHRLAAQMSSLIERLGGMVRSAPAVRDLNEPQSPDAAAFADDLLAGRYNMVILPTGRGARALMSVMERLHPRAALLDALGKVTTVVRGPGAVNVLRQWQMSPTVAVDEPNTWRSVLMAIEALGPVAGLRIAIQESAAPTTELADALRQRGADVTSVRVHTHALPEDSGPIASAIEAVIVGQIDVAMFTSPQQVHNVWYVAERMGRQADLREAMRRVLVGSVGPTTSEVLRSLRLGLTGVADVVEFHRGPGGQWTPFPVEYKRGKPKPEACDAVQLCAQALCLEEMLKTAVPAGAIFYGTPRRRQALAIDAGLRGKTEQAAQWLHRLFDGGKTPPAVYEKRCERCSLLALCMPRLAQRRSDVSRYVSQTVGRSLESQ